MSEQPPPVEVVQPGVYPQVNPQGGYPPPNQQAMYNQQQPGGYPQPQPGYGMPPQGYGQPPPGQQPPPGNQMMPRPTVPGCPPGLEYLTQVDQLLIQQQIELLEVFTGWESKNKYVVRNSVGQQVYFASEESDLCMRQCCGPQRSFTIHILDNMGQEVMRAHRSFKCCGGCCWCASMDCAAHELEVESPPGTLLGFVRQECSVCQPCFEVMDANRQCIFKIRGPICFCQNPCCRADIDFEVLPKDGAEGQSIGKISKQWTGLVREMFSDADNFGVTFPMDLDVKIKAVLFGAVFLIDFMYFEQQNNNN